MPFRRVIPRDLFNEAKLLKCLGQLSLLIHEGKDIHWPLSMEVDDTCDTEFLVDQNTADGSLFCSNVGLKAFDRHIHLSSSYNSRAPYPLNFEFGLDSGRVLNDDGTLSQEFMAFLDSFEADVDDIDEDYLIADTCDECGQRHHGECE